MNRHKKTILASHSTADVQVKKNKEDSMAAKGKAFGRPKNVPA